MASHIRARMPQTHEVVLYPTPVRPIQGWLSAATFIPFGRRRIHYFETFGWYHPIPAGFADVDKGRLSTDHFRRHPCFNSTLQSRAELDSIQFASPGGSS